MPTLPPLLLLHLLLLHRGLLAHPQHLRQLRPLSGEVKSLMGAGFSGYINIASGIKENLIFILVGTGIHLALVRLVIWDDFSADS